MRSDRLQHATRTQPTAEAWFALLESVQISLARGPLTRAGLEDAAPRTDAGAEVVGGHLEEGGELLPGALQVALLLRTIGAPLLAGCPAEGCAARIISHPSSRPVSLGGGLHSGGKMQHHSLASILLHRNASREEQQITADRTLSCLEEMYNMVRKS